jgi:hypothetical protein
MLKELISRMDVPDLRRDLTKLENIRWLNNNLGFRNSQHPNYREAMEKIKLILILNRRK